MRKAPMSEAESTTEVADAQTQTAADTQTAPTMDEVADALETLNDAVSAAMDEQEQMDEQAAEQYTGELVETLAAAKDAEDAVESFRKDVVQTELDSRLRVGDSFESGDIRMTRVESHNKYVSDEEELLAAFDEAGEDTSEVLEVNASDAYKVAEESDELEADELVGKYNYDFYRSQ